jgi:hypothetical protein
MPSQAKGCACSRNTESSSRMSLHHQFPNSGGNNIFQCPHCLQRWFCYNDHMRLWGKVDDDLTWKFLINGVDVPISIGGYCVVVPGYEQHAIDPVHKICTEKVFRPKIRMEKILDDETVVVQWTGDYHQENIFEYQFNFPIAASLEKYKNDMSSLYVIFIGQIKYWPDQRQVASMAKNFDDSKMEKCIVYLMSANHAQEYGDGSIGPASFIVEVVLLGDPNVGVIRPRRYFDPLIDEMVVEEFNKKNKA